MGLGGGDKLVDMLRTLAVLAALSLLAEGAPLAAAQLEDGSFPGTGDGDDRVRCTALGAMTLGAMTLAVQRRYARVLSR